MMEHISPLLIAIISLISGGGVSVMLSHFSKRYREAKKEKEIALFREAIEKSSLEALKTRIERIKTEADKDSWILEQLETVKKNLHQEQDKSRALERKLAIEVSSRRMTDQKLISTLTSIHEMCTCGAKRPLGNVIIALTEKYDGK